jgi:hypothetical protein
MPTTSIPCTFIVHDRLHKVFEGQPFLNQLYIARPYNYQYYHASLTHDVLISFSDLHSIRANNSSHQCKAREYFEKCTLNSFGCIVWKCFLEFKCSYSPLLFVWKCSNSQTAAAGSLKKRNHNIMISPLHALPYKLFLPSYSLLQKTYANIIRRRRATFVKRCIRLCLLLIHSYESVTGNICYKCYRYIAWFIKTLLSCPHDANIGPLLCPL